MTIAKKNSLNIVLLHISFAFFTNLATFTITDSPFIMRSMFMPGACVYIMSAIALFPLNMLRADSSISGFERSPETDGFCIIEAILD